MSVDKLWPRDRYGRPIMEGSRIVKASGRGSSRFLNAGMVEDLEIYEDCHNNDWRALVKNEEEGMSKLGRWGFCSGINMDVVVVKDVDLEEARRLRERDREEKRRVRGGPGGTRG